MAKLDCDEDYGIHEDEKRLKHPSVINLSDIECGKLNIVEAPCGSGKTTWIEDVLVKEAWWGDMLYLIDTRNGKEAFKERGKDTWYDWDSGEAEYTYHKGITCMTYACFAALCIYKPQEWLWNDQAALIVCDELHSCIAFSKIPQRDGVNYNARALEEIRKRVYIGAKVVAIDATPRTIRDVFADEYKNIPLHGKLYHYHNKEIKTYKSIWSIIQKLTPDKRYLIYTKRISDMNDIYNNLPDVLHESAECIWSDKAKFKLSKNQQRVREAILRDVKNTEATLPDDIKVLIINSAMETSINIKNSNINCVIIADRNTDTQVQARGRVRNDVETVWIPSNNIVADIKNGIAEPLVIPDKFLNRELRKKDTDRLCNILNLLNCDGRLIKWNTIKQVLYNYNIEHQKKHGESIYIITTRG